MSKLSLDSTPKESIPEATDGHSSEVKEADTVAVVTGEDQSQSILQETSSNKEIVEVWLNFYNEQYWSCYQQFAGLTDGSDQQQTSNLLEDFVPEKTSNDSKVRRKPKKEKKTDSIQCDGCSRTEWQG